MSLGKLPMKAGGGAQWNANLEQGTQVSTATQRVATTTSHLHTEKVSGNTDQPVYQPRGREGEGKLPQKCTIIWSLKLHDLPEQVCIIYS